MILRRTARSLLEASVRADGLVQVLWMNVLWLLTSLTLLGAPAATAALHRVAAQRADGDESAVLPRYLDALRHLALPATIVGAVLAALWVLLAVDVVIATLMVRPVGVVVLGLAGAVAIPLALVTTTVPSVLADGSDRALGTRGILVAVGVRTLREPLDALLRPLATLLIVLAALAFPPTLLLLPAPTLLVLAALRRRRAASRTLHPLQERTTP